MDENLEQYTITDSDILDWKIDNAVEKDAEGNEYKSSGMTCSFDGMSIDEIKSTMHGGGGGGDYEIATRQMIIDLFS